MLLRDKFWLWGHPEGCYNNSYGNTGVSRMTPMECCCYLGIRNTFMVPDGEHTNATVNRRQYNKSFTTLNQVGWECRAASENADAVLPFIEDARDFENIGCLVFDDFQGYVEDSRGKGEDAFLANILKARDYMKNNDVRPLDLWMVQYTMLFGVDEERDKQFAKYIDPFDGLIMWTWEEKDYLLIPEKFEIMKKQAPGKRFMFGCYLYNFGENKQATGEAVKWQLDWYREKLLSGEAEGVVFHSNTMADLDYEAYDVAYKWMQEHGDEVIPG